MLHIILIINKTPLYKAVENNYIDIIKLLLSHPKIQINDKDQNKLKEWINSGYTSKLWIEEQILQKLHEMNCIKLEYITKQNKEGKNAIQICIDNEAYKSLNILMEYGKSIFKDNFSNLLPPRRVIILGDEGVGKTTLKNLFKQYKPDNESITSKIPILGRKIGFPNEDFATDGIEVSNIGNIIFWDFGGQEIFHSTHQFFISEDVQYIIVIDFKKLFENNITNRNKNKDSLSYNEQTLQQTKYWLKIIEEYSRNHTSPPPIIIASHCDLLSNNTPKYYFEQLKNILKQCSFNENRIKSISKFIFSKQKNVYEHIKIIYDKIDNQTKEYILNNSLNIDKDPLVFYYALLKKKLDDEKMKNGEEKKYIWWNDYLELCYSIGLTNQNDISKVTKVLINFGIILAFKHKSSSGIPIVILDPEWLANAFKSLISIEYQRGEGNKGFIKRITMEKKWKEMKINENIWDSMIKLFQMFNMLSILPDKDKYFIPHMLYAKRINHENEYNTYNKKIEYIKEQYNIKYNDNNIHFNDMICYDRILSFSDDVPHGFLDRIIIRILHYPIPFEIDDKFIWKNQFLLYSKYYWILLCINDDNEKELRMKIFVIDNEYDKSIDGSFFHFFIFNSSEEVLKNKYFASPCKQLQSILYYNNNEIGNENNIIKQIIFSNDNNDNNQLLNQCPDLSLRGIKHINLDSTIITKRLASGTFGVAWLAKNNQNNHLIVLKELKNAEKSIEHQKEFLREALLMQKLSSCNHLIQIIGVGNISQSLIHSVNQLEEDINNKIKQGKENNISNDEIEKLIESKKGLHIANSGLLMILEFANLGDLTYNLQTLKGKSLKLKLKIALDIIKGIHELHSTMGIEFIHRDIRSPNIFVFSLDEDKINHKEFIHAKIGDFGTLVVGSPTYHQEIGAWQYMPPEAFKCDLQLGYNQSIDIYSFGMILWEIFSCEPPYKEYMMESHLIKPKITQGFRLPIPDDMPNNIQQILQLSWHQDPKQRPTPEYIINILQNEIYS